MTTKLTAGNWINSETEVSESCAELLEGGILRAWYCIAAIASSYALTETTTRVVVRHGWTANELREYAQRHALKVEWSGADKARAEKGTMASAE